MSALSGEKVADAHDEAIDKALVKIRDNFERVFGEDFGRGGAFSFHKTHSDAPNPCINFREDDVIGLPLSTREAEWLRSQSTPLDADEDGRTSDTTSNTWKVDGELVSFGNRKWGSFVTDSARQACEVFGVKGSKLLDCKLDAMLLLSAGAQSPPQIQSSTHARAFATMLVVLPCHFSGGAVHISHNGLLEVYDCSADSSRGVSIMAWYAGVTYEAKPITEGYQLALSYSMICGGQGVPRVAALSPATDRLRQVLITWRDASPTRTPEKLMCLLGPTAAASFETLRGADARKVAVLATLAKQLGFRLGLANVDYTISGIANDLAMGCLPYGCDEFDFVDPDDCIRELKISDFVDSNGDKMDHELEYDEFDEELEYDEVDEERAETIPRDFMEAIESDGRYKQKYEEGFGERGSIDNKYERGALLVIWPKRNDPTIYYHGFSGLLRLCRHICDMASSDPTPSAIDLINVALDRAVDQPKIVADTVCHAAYTWNDLALWTKAASICSSIRGIVLSPEELVKAISLFGLPALKSNLDEMMRNEEDNTQRLALCGFLLEGSSELPGDDESKKLVRDWAQAHRIECIRTLRKPKPNERNLLIATAKLYGGIEFLRDYMLHQICHLADAAFLRHLAIAVHADPSFAPSHAKTAVITSLFTNAVSKISFIPVVPPGERRLDNENPRFAFSYELGLAREVVAMAGSLGCTNILGLIIERVLAAKDHSGTSNMNWAVRMLLPFAAFLNSSSCSEFRLPSQFLTLQRTCVALYLDWLKSRNASRETLTQKHFSMLMRMLAVGHGPDLLATSICGSVSGDGHMSGSELQIFVEAICDKRNEAQFRAAFTGPSIDEVIATLAQKALLKLGLSSVKDIITALNWCIKIEVPSLHTDFVQRFCLSTVKWPREKERYINDKLLPLLPRLRPWANATGRDVNGMVREILGAWRETVLGTPPALADREAVTTQRAALGEWSRQCQCDPCQRTVEFLTQDERDSLELLHLGAGPRDHVQSHLYRYARALATFDTIRGSGRVGLDVQSSSPSIAPALADVISQVRQSENLRLSIRWEKDCKAGHTSSTASARTQRNYSTSWGPSMA